MPERWLSIIGIGEAGMDSLSPAARARVEAAEVIVGGDRHRELSDRVSAERLDWPHPLAAVIDVLKAHRGRALVVLVTGDPLWYSIGARIGRLIPPEEIEYHPQISAFQWASARLGWSLADLETLTAHGRPIESVLPFLWPGRRLLILTAGVETPGAAARLLAERGYGASLLIVLGQLGASHESRHEALADEWAAHDPAEILPDLHILAVECRGQPIVLMPRWSLPDSAFDPGSTMPEEIRVMTLARLMPARLETLWDIGAGCGSVAIEWCRAARDAEAVIMREDAARLEKIRINATALGATRLRIVKGTLAEAGADLPAPDAVHLGGTLSAGMIEAALTALLPGGRLVANAMTRAEVALLARMHARHGGSLRRLSVEQAASSGNWQEAGRVTQWSLIRSTAIP